MPRPNLESPGPTRAFGFQEECMAYKAIADVPGIETSAVDIKELDTMLVRVIETTRVALKHRYNFRRRVIRESELISILHSQLILYSKTHKSLRLILARAYDEEDYAIIPDATSLVREQIEKIYVIALFLSNPRKWILHYSRSAWRSDFERYLLEREEYGEIERHKEFLTKHFPEYLANIQRPRVGAKTETVVSDFAKRALEHRWCNPGDERPVWFVNAQKKKKKKANRLRDYIRNYFEFPTPGKAAASITNKSLRQFLFRWHKEYSMICQYSHVAFGKIMIPTMSEFKDIVHAEKTEINGKKLAEQTVYLSFISAASSCALILSVLKDTYGARNELKNFWKVLYETSLPAKVFWEMYVKDIL